eukprot:CAMPEP_0113557730 /NCGR_PEP_ID=MMETSP0015_2-20120614/17953_1 /TAXON_ID=2838 /ORGANISM="Odontella" /LENGTH=117 /DNA_ID=CAMNT_0000459187 /DNA_START=57 /DNA_END=410 /DNA_ORIENTATION=- /assembly_acc=CAM_ASM_000160
MTRLSVVSALTNLGGVGSADLGERDLDATTIGDVKRMVAERFDDVATETESGAVKFWWRGYVLNDDSLPVRKACVGVNREEVVASDAESLVLFLTVAEKAAASKRREAPSSRIPSLF